MKLKVYFIVIVSYVLEKYRGKLYYWKLSLGESLYIKWEDIFFNFLDFLRFKYVGFSFWVIYLFGIFDFIIRV